MILIGDTDESTFNTIVQDIADETQRIQSQINECIDAYNNRSAWDAVRLELLRRAERLRELLIRVRDIVVELMATIADFLSPGNPFQMMRVKLEWDRVTERTTGQIGMLDTGLFKGTASWSGYSGHAYRSLPNMQSAAISGLTPHLSAFATLLNNHATDLVTEWLKMAGRLLKYVVDQAKNVSAFVSADPLQWLSIVPSIVDLAATLAGYLIDVTVNLQSYASKVVNEIATLKSALANVTGSQAGEWPTLRIETP